MNDIEKQVNQLVDQIVQLAKFKAQTEQDLITARRELLKLVFPENGRVYDRTDVGV